MESIVLIGMPSAGKTASGRLLAERLGYDFLDGDELIRASTGEELSRSIARLGTEGFLALEERTLLSVRSRRAVIATGGSAVYSQRAMAHLKTLGTVVYLKIAEEETERRIADPVSRGVVMRGNITTLGELYAEREPLYEKYADVTVDCTGKSSKEVAEELSRL